MTLSARNLQEQFVYGYDKAWNLNMRTNNALHESFSVNNVNELSSAGYTGSLTVAGTATEPLYPNSDPGVTSVTVSGTGLSSGAAQIYEDGTWARAGANPVSGNNSYTAVAQDNLSRSSTYTANYYLPTPISYSYDANGNLLSDGTRNFAYDCENELTAAWVAGSWSNNFVYDGLLRKRVEKDYGWNGSAWLETNEIRYVYDGYLVVQERNANNLPQVTYTRGSDLSGNLQDAGGIGGLLARTDMGLWVANQSFASAFYFNDSQGNVVGMFNSNQIQVAQYEYDPFGNMLNMNGPLASKNKIRFSSKEWEDGPGLYYYWFRFYDPNLQRWLNRDPLGDLGSLVSVGPLLDEGAAGKMTSDEIADGMAQINGNLFAALGNNPVGTIDLYGLQEACLGEIPPELIQQAVELNRGAARVDLPDGRKVDLFDKFGRGHFDKATQQRVPTPHVHEPAPSPYAPRFSDWTRPATLDDIKDVLDHLQGGSGGGGNSSVGGCGNCNVNAPPQVTIPIGTSETPPPQYKVPPHCIEA